MTERGRRQSEMGDSSLGDVQSSGKGGDDRRPPAPSALHVVSTTTGNRGSVRDQVTILGGQTEMGR
jgi:hypothetical protein